MKREVGYIYKNSNSGEHFRSIEKNGELCLENPSYPFVFLFDVQQPLELVGSEEEFGHLVKEEEYEFYEGDELNVEVDKNGNLKKVDPIKRPKLWKK